MTYTPLSLVDEVVGRSGSSNGGRPVSAERSRSLQWLGRNGLPGPHEEAWKYTPLKDLMARRIDRVATAADGSVSAPDLEATPSLPDEIRVVLVDGIHRPDLMTGEVPEGLAIVSLEDDMSDGTIAGVDPEARRVDGFQMLNQSIGYSGVRISLARGTALERPVHVIHASGGSGEALLVQPRVEIDVDDNAQLVLLESFVGSAQAVFVNALTNVTLARGAVLRHYKVQNQAVGSVHLSSVRARQDTGSALKAGAFMFGASIARNSIDVLAQGDHTNSDLYGLYLPNGSQRIDNVVTVEHAGNDGASHQTYKGVVDGRARGSFSGHIIVDHGTVGTDAHQSNKTLLLDAAAQSDSRPWLEIFADDVTCTHGSAIGQLDEQAMFYMRSRGIPVPDARAILVGGFINEIVDRLMTESIRNLVMDLVHDHVRSGLTAELGGEH